MSFQPCMCQCWSILPQASKRVAGSCRHSSRRSTRAAAWNLWSRIDAEQVAKHQISNCACWGLSPGLARPPLYHLGVGTRDNHEISWIVAHEFPEICQLDFWKWSSHAPRHLAWDWRCKKILPRCQSGWGWTWQQKERTYALVSNTFEYRPTVVRLARLAPNSQPQPCAFPEKLEIHQATWSKHQTFQRKLSCWLEIIQYEPTECGHLDHARSI